eukprot:989014-Amphidinium_carterae.2
MQRLLDGGGGDPTLHPTPNPIRAQKTVKAAKIKLPAKGSVGVLTDTGPTEEFYLEKEDNDVTMCSSEVYLGSAPGRKDGSTMKTSSGQFRAASAFSGCPVVGSCSSAILNLRPGKGWDGGYSQK